ncbi:unnamed protein product, partial [Musa acuminata subsp. burmannicoides]
EISVWSLSCAETKSIDRARGRQKHSRLRFPQRTSRSPFDLCVKCRRSPEADLPPNPYPPKVLGSVAAVGGRRRRGKDG